MLSNVTEVDATIEKHKKSGSRVAESLLNLKRHRMNLAEQMGYNLRDAATDDDPIKIDQLLKDSVPYGSDLHAPRKALERRSVFQWKNPELTIERMLIVLMRNG